MTPGKTSELARINGTLLEACAQAHEMLAADKLGPDFTKLVRHARGLHDRLQEALTAAEPAIDPVVRELAAQMGQRIALLEEALDRPADGDGHELQ